MRFEFTAESVVSYIEDDVCVVSFADTPSDEPEKYLILSQALFDSGSDDEAISIEYGGNGDSVTAEVVSAWSEPKLFVLEVDPAAVGVSEFHIHIASPVSAELRDHLKMVFSKSPAKLELL
ncbi:hypothetical protein [Trinickia sp.]|uniref:hypothetical protein n=1 Tax=Trinickia sp. TaxID=2571163 RepID=UPI003F7CF777